MRAAEPALPPGRVRGGAPGGRGEGRALGTLPSLEGMPGPAVGPAGAGPSCPRLPPPPQTGHFGEGRGESGCPTEGLPQALRGSPFPALHFRRCRAGPGSKGRRLHRVSPAALPARPAGAGDGRPRPSEALPPPRGGRFCHRGERSFGCSWGGPFLLLRGGSPVPHPRAEQQGWVRNGTGSACFPVTGNPMPPFSLQVPSPPASVPRLLALPRQQQQAARLWSGRCWGPQPRHRSLPSRDGGRGNGSPRGGPAGAVSPHPRPSPALGHRPGAGRAAGMRLPPSVPFHGGPGWAMGKGMRGPGGAAGAALAPALLAAGERQPAASSAVPSASHPRLQLCCSIPLLLGEDTKREKK